MLRYWYKPSYWIWWWQRRGAWVLKTTVLLLIVAAGFGATRLIPKASTAKVYTYVTTVERYRVRSVTVSRVETSHSTTDPSPKRITVVDRVTVPAKHVYVTHTVTTTVPVVSHDVVTGAAQTVVETVPTTETRVVTQRELVTTVQTVTEIRTATVPTTVLRTVTLTQSTP